MRLKAVLTLFLVIPLLKSEAFQPRHGSSFPGQRIVSFGRKALIPVGSPLLRKLLSPLSLICPNAFKNKKVKDWKRKYCSISGLRARYGRNENLNAGDWNYKITRGFYNVEINRALDELKTLGLPEELWGALAYKARNTIKRYSRERSFFVWTVTAIAWGAEAPSLSDLEQKYRKEVVEADGRLTEKEIKIRVSLKIFESARRTRQSANDLVYSSLPDLVELALN